VDRVLQNRADLHLGHITGRVAGNIGGSPADAGKDAFVVGQLAVHNVKIDDHDLFIVRGGAAEPVQQAGDGQAGPGNQLDMVGAVVDPAAGGVADLGPVAQHGTRPGGVGHIEAGPLAGSLVDIQPAQKIVVSGHLLDVDRDRDLPTLPWADLEREFGQRDRQVNGRKQIPLQRTGQDAIAKAGSCYQYYDCRPSPEGEIRGDFILG